MQNHLAIALKASIWLLAAVPARADEKKWDWREALLAEEGIEDSPEALRKFLDGKKLADAGLLEPLQRLGAADFEIREEAQRELIRGGDPAFRWLKNRKPFPDPEVQERVRQILVILGSGQEKAREEALDHAVRTLLEEGHQRRKDTGGRFFEWFGEDDAMLNERYHAFGFQNDNKRSGLVKDGRLILSGKGGTEGDQSMVLKSGDWPGRASFGDRFRVSTRLGGALNGVAAWHVGISIGNVRALYHPGYRGGGFRFSSVGELKSLSGQNDEMGFTPDSEPLEQMTVEAQKRADGDVVLTVTVRSGGEKPKEFRKQIVVTKEVIGPLDRITLDRSGREGGEAYFKDFSVVLDPAD